MVKTRTPNVEAFLAANAKSPVISGACVSPTQPKGVRYRLENGKAFILNREEVATIGCPRWKL